INTRLCENRSTIVSTNCSFDELLRKYGPQVTSRLEGEYLLLSFSGRDIRLLRKERGT
ncbi:MAG TPA: DNA replication protein DnaC, partial [Candidatus Scatomorpha pullistercoris]|nr:DNA replication protein DnaC [Candidatus Scatomorpha pullistercoris]